MRETGLSRVQGQLGSAREVESITQFEPSIEYYSAEAGYRVAVGAVSMCDLHQSSPFH